MNDAFESPLDTIIREARERGAFEALPGRGKPLQWEDESLVPEDARLAQRVLKNSGFAPDWIELGRQMDAEALQARAALSAARAALAGGRLDETGWQVARTAFTAQIRALNLRIIGYNLRAPGPAGQRAAYPTDPDHPENAR
jgi:hypothetical protein